MCWGEGFDLLETPDMLDFMFLCLWIQIEIKWVKYIYMYLLIFDNNIVYIFNIKETLLDFLQYNQHLTVFV